MAPMGSSSGLKPTAAAAAVATMNAAATETAVMPSMGLGRPTMLPRTLSRQRLRPLLTPLSLRAMMAAKRVAPLAVTTTVATMVATRRLALGMTALPVPPPYWRPVGRRQHRQRRRRAYLHRRRRRYSHHRRCHHCKPQGRPVEVAAAGARPPSGLVDREWGALCVRTLPSWPPPRRAAGRRWVQRTAALSELGTKGHYASVESRCPPPKGLLDGRRCRFSMRLLGWGCPAAVALFRRRCFSAATTTAWQLSTLWPTPRSSGFMIALASPRATRLAIQVWRRVLPSSPHPTPRALNCGRRRHQRAHHQPPGATGGSLRAFHPPAIRHQRLPAGRSHRIGWGAHHWFNWPALARERLARGGRPPRCVLRQRSSPARGGWRGAPAHWWGGRGGHEPAAHPWVGPPQTPAPPALLLVVTGAEMGRPPCSSPQLLAPLSGPCPRHARPPPGLGWAAVAWASRLSRLGHYPSTPPTPTRTAGTMLARRRLPAGGRLDRWLRAAAADAAVAALRFMAIAEGTTARKGGGGTAGGPTVPPRRAPRRWTAEARRCRWEAVCAVAAAATRPHSGSRFLVSLQEGSSEVAAAAAVVRDGLPTAAAPSGLPRPPRVAPTMATVAGATAVFGVTAPAARRTRRRTRSWVADVAAWSRWASTSASAAARAAAASPSATTSIATGGWCTSSSAPTAAHCARPRGSNETISRSTSASCTTPPRRACAPSVGGRSGRRTLSPPTRECVRAISWAEGRWRARCGRVGEKLSGGGEARRGVGKAALAAKLLLRGAVSVEWEGTLGSRKALGGETRVGGVAGMGREVVMRWGAEPVRGAQVAGKLGRLTCMIRITLRANTTLSVCLWLLLLGRCPGCSSRCS